MTRLGRRRGPGAGGAQALRGRVARRHGRARRRVVVTGWARHALGADVATTWDGLVAGRSGIRADHRVRPVPARLADRRRGARASIPSRRPRPQGAAPHRPLHPARAAGDAARRWTRPGSPGGSRARWPSDRRRSSGPASAAAITLRRADRRSTSSAARTGSARSSSRWRSPTCAAARSAIVFGALGPNYRHRVSACASGGHAIGEAWETIRRGDADVMIAGGRGGRRLRAARGAASPRCGRSPPATTTRPAPSARSTAGRDGFVIAEGAGVARPRDLSHARPRGARILVEVVGYGATADAQPPHAARARRRAAPCARPAARSRRPA